MVAREHDADLVGGGHAGAEERSGWIREGMAVEDAPGERYGRVIAGHSAAAAVIASEFAMFVVGTVVLPFQVL